MIDFLGFIYKIGVRAMCRIRVSPFCSMNIWCNLLFACFTSPRTERLRFPFSIFFSHFIHFHFTLCATAQLLYIWTKSFNKSQHYCLKFSFRSSSLSRHVTHARTHFWNRSTNAKSDFGFDLDYRLIQWQHEFWRKFCSFMISFRFLCSIRLFIILYLSGRWCCDACNEFIWND